MEFVNNSLFKKALFGLLICCINFNSHAQQDDVKITLRDYHSAKITTAKASSIHPYFFTADESGKVLVYSTETKRAVKTLRPANGIPVKSLRLSNDDRVLTINQKYDFSDGKTDSIISISIFDQKILMQNAGNVEFIGSQDDAILLKDTNADGSLNIIDVFNKNFEKVTRFYSSYEVIIGAYNFPSGEVAMVQKQYLNQLNVLFLQKDDYKKESIIPIPESLEVIKLFYDSNSLFALTNNTTSKIIEIYDLTKYKAFKSPVYEILNDFNATFNIEISKEESLVQIVITDKYGFSTQPFIINKKANKFKSMRPKTEKSVSNSVYLIDKNEHLFFESFNPNFSSYVSFLIFDNDAQKVIKTVPEESKSYYFGAFLPNDSWIVHGRELNSGNFGIGQSEYQLKYYETGTFYNRFGKLDYNNLMEAKHGIKDFSNKEFTYNKYTSVHPFYGSKNKSEFEAEYGFYTYDLMKDEVELISVTETNKHNIVDYNSATETLLLSQRAYYNGGHTDPQEFVILKNDDILEIEGLYKFGKFSADGQYVLLISSLNEVSIRLVETMEVLHSETLVDGKYKIFADQVNEFLISNAFWKIEKDKCNTSSIGFSMDSGHKVTVQKMDCINILDFDSVDDITVLSIEYLGLSIGEKVYKFPSSEFPTRVSLNSDGSKLMASFNNGKIRIYQTHGLKLLSEMLHPDKYSHVFVDSSNNYFSNVKPDDFVLAALNGKSTSVQDFEERYFKPEEVLKSFGTPNTDYVSTLKKALALKRENQYTNTDVILESLNSASSEKGDLYVLSIGVSDYNQTDYNLTFADKDALDIARIYGSLNEADNEAYQAKFYGHKYGLNDNAGELISGLKRYSGLYKRNGNLYALNKNRTLWLEHDDGTFNLWDFNKNTIDDLKLSSGFKMVNNSFNEVVFIHPDGKGFYIVSEDGAYYFYSFSDKKFKLINLPFNIDYKSVFAGSLKPLINNQWAYFSTNSVNFINQAKVSFGTINTEGAEREVKFNINAFEFINDSGLRQQDSAVLYFVRLKALSPNGQHILYGSNDNDLFYVDLSKTTITPLKLDIKLFDKYDDVYISDDGLTLSIVKRMSNGYKYEVATYTLLGELIKNFSLDIDAVGFSGYNNELLWIKSSEPLVKEDYFKTDSLLSSNSPKSFKKTHVKYLTNNQATSKNIKIELKDFFKKVKPSDQVILFLAGHGVLDEDLNYYFAPHDMLFDNVKANGISFNTIIESLKQINTSNSLLLMDSCHSGNTLDMEEQTVTSVDTANTSNQRGSKSRRVNSKSKFKVSDVISDLFEDFLSKSGVTVISASSGEDVAYENKALGNGAFTSAYINALKIRLIASGFVLSADSFDKSVPLTDDAITELFKQVMILTNGKQTSDLRELNSKSKLKMW